MKKIRVALSGNPNCGKSSIFNQLTGLKQKVTNIPGTTIERKIGFLKHQSGKFEIIDTPGTYSLKAKSVDEEHALEIYTQEDQHPDLILYVADSTNLKRHLYFFSQLAELNIPVVLVLNMMDVAAYRGVQIDVERLEKELGIPIIKTNARTGEGIAELKDAIAGKLFKSHYQFLNYMDNEEEHKARYDGITRLLSNVVQQKTKRELLTAKIDPIVTHPIYGYLIFLFILFIVFQSIFTLAEWPMQLIEYLFDKAGEGLRAVVPGGWIQDIMVNGIVAGLAGVIVFIPQIAILFFFMSILEDTGYMARVSFIMDKLLRGLGLNGKSVVPLLSGAACAIPAIMAARNIENWKDRMITIMVTPLMSCSARLPVYTLLISMAIPEGHIWGLFNVRGLMLLGMYVLGTVASLIAALVFKFFIKKRSTGYFIMELPMYHPPRWKNIGLLVYQKCQSFVVEAGKVILIVSVILWFLASYGPSPESSWYQPQQSDHLDESYAGHFGKSVEPAIRPLGFNWKIGIALMTSFAAREVFVGTMSTIYSVDDEENIGQIRSKMQNDIDSKTGKPVYSLAVIISLMIFYAFAMQCISTLAVVFKETKTWRWPVIMFIYMTSLAYVASYVAYQILS